MVGEIAGALNVSKVTVAADVKAILRREIALVSRNPVDYGTKIFDNGETVFTPTG
jgi:hypothetical protein